MLLEVAHVSKRFRNGVQANDDISLSVEAGEVFGLLGPNGAGKTTLVRQVLGSLTPDAGSIHIGGIDVVSRPAAARSMCSFQPQAAAPVTGLSAMEAIELVGRLRGGSKADVRARANQLTAALDLESAADKPRPMSGGMARLTGFCMAAVVPGQVVILDEPTNDVDPLRRRTLWQLIRGLADDGAAVLLVTHNVLEAERCVDRLAIVAGGRVQASGSPASLKSALGAPLRIECSYETTPPQWPESLELAPVGARRAVGSIELSQVASTVAWAKDAQDSGQILEFAVVPASLEDVYASWVVPNGADA
jgi:ABC-2 type transport system ATP-binding protein